MKAVKLDQKFDAGNKVIDQLDLKKARRPGVEAKRVKDFVEQNRSMAKYIAMVVRNAMEDFHVAHLSDAQMRELNPIIRDAVYTALYAMRRANDDPASQAFVDFALRLIPEYWEEPELLPDYVSLKELK